MLGLLCMILLPSALSQVSAMTIASTEDKSMAKIGVIGGTGALGKAIARRLAKAGHAVTIGSRAAESAAATAAELGAAGGATNADAAAGQDVVIVTVP